MPGKLEPGSRYRVEYRRGRWYCVHYDTAGREVAISPDGNELDAERYMKNHKAFGQWFVPENITK